MKLKMNRENRPKVPIEFVKDSLNKVFERIEKKTLKHGGHAYASTHEIYGIVAEEFKELMDELHSNDTDEFESELIDVAVGAVWGLASMKLLREKGIYYQPDINDPKVKEKLYGHRDKVS